MRISAITALTLALAAPAVSASPAREETTGRVSYNDKAPPPPPITSAASDGWVELASATPARHGREFISIGADTGVLTRLRLTAASGRAGIQAVKVEYTSGKRQTFVVDRTITAKRPAYVDLRGPREIAQIIVISDRDSPGSYVVEGLTGPTGVAMR